MKFTLRRLFSVVTIIGILLGLSRRALAALFNFADLPDFAKGFWASLSSAFWLLGAPEFDPYRGRKRYEMPDSCALGEFIGMAVAIGLWIGLLFVVAVLIQLIWTWGGYGEERKP